MALHQRQQRALYLFFRLRIHAARGFVQDQDRRVAQNGARNGDQLALSQAQVIRAAGNHRIVTCGSRVMNSSARASFAASLTSRSEEAGLEYLIFS